MAALMDSVGADRIEDVPAAAREQGQPSKHKLSLAVTNARQKVALAAFGNPQ